MDKANYIEDCLYEIRSYESYRPIQLLDIWSCRIPAKSSSNVLMYLRDVLPEEVHNLAHIKRLVKCETPDKSSERATGAGTDTDSLYLDLAICSCDTLPEIKAVQEYLTEICKEPIMCKKSVASKYQAQNKEQAAQWSATKCWPIMWRGNVSAMRTCLSKNEVNDIRNYLKKVVEMARDNKQNGELPIATLIVDPSTNRVVSSVADSRKKAGNPLRHSIMDCVASVADRELNRRKYNDVELKKGDDSDRNYLCLGLHVYTTHEPCPMCSMALMHSRVSRLIYIQSSPQVGAIEPVSAAGYNIHWNDQLNWHFDAWKWVGENLGLDEIDGTINP
ncbi:cytidine deaminase-like protein [Nadsonia fulvescens var. elongata DSM 6958]|uniref:Cytidine deaminase-like protein n=1 Tax=Nadsonia fulvescens var. elongata DSM 6958 TaxID=857566 RepID=A0A1E3PTK2_9ASCO|nr:cytidine deaminase-like protein [Nadsonia fulvescens var. elongata DSM 6958]